ncbi:MAG: hypothetical protein M3R65_02920 [Gemmatimonadota bacterium]|nr:hypothetical protein [Gemmatimonadota bacterium]
MREVLGIRLNRDGPARVIKVLGATIVRDTGDAAGATRTWCYIIRNPFGSASVDFGSNLEMAGPEFEADDIRVTRVGPYHPPDAKCAAARLDGAVTTVAGLRLGLDRKQVLHLLGEPTARAGDSLWFAWMSKRQLSHADPQYAYWNARRDECFEGKAPYANVDGTITVRIDSTGVYQFELSRDANAVC